MVLFSEPRQETAPGGRSGFGPGRSHWHPALPTQPWLLARYTSLELEPPLFGTAAWTGFGWLTSPCGGCYAGNCRVRRAVRGCEAVQLRDETCVGADPWAAALKVCQGTLHGVTSLCHQKSCKHCGAATLAVSVRNVGGACASVRRRARGKVGGKNQAEEWMGRGTHLQWKRTRPPSSARAVSANAMAFVK